MDSGEAIIGIDLGTTNSVVAVIEGAEPRVIPNLDGDHLTPSVVAFTDDGQVLVGEIARRQGVTNPRRTIHSVKRFMGRRYRELRSSERLLPYDLASGRRGYVTLRVGNRDYTPQEISAHILRSLRDAAGSYLGSPARRAVITVPAYFNDAQRQATKDAGEIAGLAVERIINEPTAAALTFGLDRRDAATVAVLDLGGGTFDVTMLRAERGVFRILSTSGDTHLGGNDFDLTLARHVAAGFHVEHGIDLLEDPQALYRLLEACERAKRELSVKECTDVTLPFIAAGATGPLHLRAEISRVEFERLVHPLVERCAGPILQALHDARLGPGDISDVILAGGGTRMPRFVEMARQLFGMDPHRGVNPEEAVARGAAIQGALLSGARRDLVLMDVTPFSLGIETAGGLMTRIIDRNTTIPTRRSEVFSTSEDNQSIVILRVYQGEHERAAHNRLLDEFHFEGVRPAHRGEPQIQVTFEVDADGILHVVAEDLETGTRQSVRIRESGGLTQKEIENLRRDLEPARGAKSQDVAGHLRHYCEALCSGLEQALRRDGDRIPAELAEAVERLVAHARSRKAMASVDLLKASIGELGRATADIHRAVRNTAREGDATAQPGSTGAIRSLPPGKRGRTRGR